MENKVVHLSIFAMCGVRDIFGLSDIDGKYVIDCFIQHINPCSVSYETPLLKELDYSDDELRCYLKDEWSGISSFDIRNACIDMKKSTLNILKENKSQYLLIDLSALKFGLYFFDDECRTALTKLHYDFFSSKFSEYISSPFREVTIYDLEEDALYEMLDKYMSSILDIYNQEKIVLVECYGINIWVDLVTGKLYESDVVNSTPFLTNETDMIRINTLIKKGFSYLQSKYPKCHIIPFPENVVGDARHKWGKGNFHYTREYYDYALEVMNNIVAS